MKFVILFFIYLILTSSIVSANEYVNEEKVIFLQNDSIKKEDNLELLERSADKKIDFVNENIPNHCVDKTQSCPCRKCKINLDFTGETFSEYVRQESIISMLQRESAESKNTLSVFCDCFLDAKKLQEKYEDLKKSGQENSTEGFLIQADIAIIEKKYFKSEEFYKKALEFDKDNENIKAKLAFCFRKQKKYESAAKIYNDLLQKNPDSLETQINSAYLEMDKENYNNAIGKFQKILNKNPDYRPAKMGLVYSYTSAAQYFSALEILNNMPKDEEVNSTKSYIYYTLGMYSDANKNLKGYINKDTIDLANQIKKLRAFTFTPSYTFLNQELSETYDLDVRKIGLMLSEYGANNIKGFIDYGMYIYMSGPYKDNHFEDVANEIKGGIEGRPTEKFAFRSDIGIKVFQVQGGMLITDSWFKYYLNDNLKFKLGFFRNNLEQSYLSAVGIPIHGIFTGQIAINKAYLEIEGRLPKKSYCVLKFNGGAMTAQNLPTNAFVDSFVILGKNIYDNHDNEWIQHAALEFMTNNISYQMNMFSIPGADPPKNTFGGYFSPSFYNAETLNFNVEGSNKKLRLKYGLKCFLGYQTMFSPDASSVVYGIYPYAAYNLNDHLAVNLSYIYSNYASVLRHFFMISVDVKLFRKARLPQKKIEAQIIKS